ncbi:hypothetical protein cyc_00158 [Cyclospora cayetanensis]|uniref:Uncharacterized protein n=1 Tax=Cyclospora cayetanensis TaxID=88456 RepID=A0A1D3D0B8_9EIME|nr:hypothetical protein cyc_00158 [Cyclospora cayetanensis]
MKLLLVLAVWSLGACMHPQRAAGDEAQPTDVTLAASSTLTADEAEDVGDSELLDDEAAATSLENHEPVHLLPTEHVKRQRALFVTWLCIDLGYLLLGVFIVLVTLEKLSVEERAQQEKMNTHLKSLQEEILTLEEALRTEKTNNHRAEERIKILEEEAKLVASRLQDSVSKEQEYAKTIEDNSTTMELLVNELVEAKKQLSEDTSTKKGAPQHDVRKEVSTPPLDRGFSGEEASGDVQSNTKGELYRGERLLEGFSVRQILSVDLASVFRSLFV